MKYTKFKELKKVNREIIVPAFERARLDKISTAIADCGDFSVLYECTSCGTREWKGFTRCKNKFCICCNAVKSLTWLAKTYSKFEKFLEEGKYIVMLTLTIRDRENLQSALDIITNAWRLFYNRDRQCAKEFKYTFEGGIKSIEVKTGENSGMWHPHLHCLLVKDHFSYDKPYIDSAWSKCVKLAGGDIDEKITYIESVYMRDEHGVKTYDKDALMRGIVESVKYITKFDYANESTERLQELVGALNGVRHIDTFGCCKNIHKDVEDELSEQVKINEIVEHACKICGCNESKLVQMVTERMFDSDVIVLTDEMNIGSEHSEEFIEGFKASNGKRSWDGLIDDDGKQADNDKLEELFYQTSIFDVPTLDANADNLDKLFFEATKNDIKIKP